MVGSLALAVRLPRSCGMLRGASLAVAVSEGLLLMMSHESTVSQATVHWTRLFADADPDRMAALYLPQAVLWGTFATRLIQGRSGIREYFVRAFATGISPQAELGEHVARVYGEVAVCSGHYTFALGVQGEARTLPARFSFTFQRQDGLWLIADHHSSLMPSPA